MSRSHAAMEYGLTIVGSATIGFAIKNIFDPISLVTGGVSGIAIIVKAMTEHLIDGGVPLWVTNTLLNIPLFLAAIRLKGWKFIKQTLLATITLSISLYIVPELKFPTQDLLLSSLFGGIITGIGTGMVFMSRATTGGTDMLAALLQHKRKHYSIAQIMQVLDAVVVLAGAYLFGLSHALYALIAIYAVSKVSDGIIEGLKFSKVAFIISDQSEVIAGRIMQELERGVTGLKAKGMYSNESREMLFCVVSKKEIVQIKEIVEEVDLKAFIIVSDAREVFGEGFIEYKQ